MFLQLFTVNFKYFSGKSAASKLQQIFYSETRRTRNKKTMKTMKTMELGLLVLIKYYLKLGGVQLYNYRTGN